MTDKPQTPDSTIARLCSYRHLYSFCVEASLEVTSKTSLDKIIEASALLKLKQRNHFKFDTGLEIFAMAPDGVTIRKVSTGRDNGVANVPNPFGAPALKGTARLWGR
ncbi:hypothetical protein SAMN04488523_13012 [Sulfitobacter brevis]|uniref:Uncharacterized protein n=1 Tax=Sulfitobacter brevis TaxID=74348 RepID=A0A1I2GV85_9RHOB|nr:hypothetical protein SAMN04488523_13012 [Sulfitobacter brevis]